MNTSQAIQNGAKLKLYWAQTAPQLTYCIYDCRDIILNDEDKRNNKIDHGNCLSCSIPLSPQGLTCLTISITIVTAKP